MPTTRVLTRSMLRTLNAKAIRAKASRSLEPAFIDGLPEGDIFPISQSMLHNDADVRLRIVVNRKGDIVELDITLADYDRLPVVTTTH